jgi:hypothetical protein
VAELEVKRPIEDLDVGGRIILGWVLRDIGWDYMDWINVAHDKILWWAFVNTVLSFWVVQNVGKLMSS